ncbi:uncharacterized protein EDB93DRAFT_1107974 [Suillus bovinus]|uniref:uncharacterized protein n=1 Tax=Suillus bovinus TaxID=48563 RepID=UPI001B87EE1A|nr:uncharacterized protein EDB93DRAFT_1107974 [Suillus bovinus]KAG2132141.1 hypothetical protein EDB93DRAFT_1107974 [Suillus bovinus]
MPGVLTNIATVYPDVQSQDMDDATFKPLFFMIRFSGTLPKHLIEQNIPVEISVSIAEEYGCFTMPFVKAILSMDQWQSDTESMLNSSDSNFSGILECDWVKLSKDIEGWLVELDTELSQWMWGWDTFWLTFVAAYPFFPRGTWPMWDPRIPLEGAFIEQCLETLGHSITVDQEIMVIDLGNTEDLKEIWGAFCRDAALFYPYPLISTN